MAVDEREDQAVEPGEDQGELFPMGSLEGDGRAMKAIFKPSHKIETTVGLMSAEVPLTGGLLDPETEVTLVVTAEVQKIVPVAQRSNDDARRLVGWKVRQMLRPVYVERAEGAMQALEARFEMLCENDSTLAHEFLERLQARFKESLED